MTKDEKYVYINYTGLNDTPVKSQKEIASDLELHYVKISRLYTSAISKISTKFGIKVNLFSKERRRSIWKKQKIGYSIKSIDDKVKLVEEISIMLHDMFPSHMSSIKIDKKLSDGHYHAMAYLGIPVKMIKDKGKYVSAVIGIQTGYQSLFLLYKALDGRSSDNQFSFIKNN